MLNTNVRVMYNTSAVILLWLINFRFTNLAHVFSIHNYDKDIVFSMNIAGGDA